MPLTKAATIPAVVSLSDSLAHLRKPTTALAHARHPIARSR
jgi:hypothetical protein